MDDIFNNLLVWMDQNRSLFIAISYFILIISLMQSIIYIVQIPFAAFELFTLRFRDQDADNWSITNSDIAQPVSMLLPAYNEGVVIIDSLRPVLALRYPIYEVIVVNDGSTDDTLEQIIEEFQLYEAAYSFEYLIPCAEIKQIYRSSKYDHLVVIDKVNGGGKADALNAGLNLARYPTFCTLDADSIIEPASLLRAVRPFISDPEQALAVGGTISLLNGCEVENGVVTKSKMPSSLLVKFQIIEYIRAFLMGRLAWRRLGILTLISGAFAVINREMTITVGGFNPKSMGEDYDLIMRIHRHCLERNIKYKIEFVPEPVCWTEAPENLSMLKNQRIRWQQGSLDVFFSNIHMFCNPRYGRIGTVALPLSFLFDVIGPIAEVSGYILIPLLYLIGIINIYLLLSFLGLLFMVGIFTNIISLVLEEMYLRRFPQVRDLLQLAFIAILENFGYRQINNIWRIRGWWRYLSNQRKWGEMTRKGINK